MRSIAIVLSTVALAVGGCGSLGLHSQQENQVGVPKNFFERTIVYTVGSEAKDYMMKLESLLGQIQQIQAPLSDELVVPLYRDTDLDRNHHITDVEAKAFYQDYVLRFEDSLGPVVSK